MSKQQKQQDSEIVGHCGYCGKALRRKSQNGRFPEFCNVDHRVKAWRQAQKDRQKDQEYATV